MKLGKELELEGRASRLDFRRPLGEEGRKYRPEKDWQVVEGGAQQAATMVVFLFLATDCWY